ncbi:unnamed protein product [Clonostachys rosea f. rosea IK726]|uniref:Uncharacterized protein n=1 Tax=Clonostachys rosea f. rosea IK726 TaxID=1349383 RepID=A0ACA9UFB3_BIOOC|nr:unnamed protein product [Clonostachys rosea f. rosea IK726]
MDQPAEDGPAALPAEDADAGIFAGFSVDEASDTLDAYIIGLGCMLDVLTEWSREERTGGHPKMEARLGLIGGLNRPCASCTSIAKPPSSLFSSQARRNAVVESNGYRMGRLRSQIAALGAFVESTRRVLHDGV